MFITLACTQVTDEGRERVKVIKELLDLHERKEIEIIASTMAMVEFRPYQGGQAHDPVLARFVDNLFNSADILLYGLTPQIALLARKLGEENPAITPVDAAHIATAVFAKADVLFTFDGDVKLQRRRPKHMIANTGKFGTPPLKISAPYVDFGPLFDPKPAE